MTDESTVDKAWVKYWESDGTFGFESDEAAEKRKVAEALDRERDLQDRLKEVYKGQNRFVRKIAAALDEQFPPEEYGKGHGTGHLSPGDLVRQFLVTPTEEATKTDT